MTRKRQRGNGEGTVYPRKNKDGKVTSYRGSYWVQTANGPKRRYVSAKTKTEAQTELRKALARLDEGLTFDAENLSLGEYLVRWLEDSVRGSVRKSTYDRYDGAVRVHIKPTLGHIKLNKLSPAHLQGFYRNRLDAGCAPASVNKMHAVLHKALSQAVEWHMVPRNVAEAVRAPRPAPEEMQPLSIQETRTFLEAAQGDRLEALYVLAVTTGMHQGEMLALKWQDMDMENATLSVRRTLTRNGGVCSLESRRRRRVAAPFTSPRRRCVRCASTSPGR